MKLLIILLFFISMLLILNGCSKAPASEPSIQNATITTIAASSVTSNAATVGGNILNDGGSIITSRGICYSQAPGPNMSNTIITSGSGIGSFSLGISNLSSNTVYYFRSFAKNSVGVAYGNEFSFTTLSPSPPIDTAMSLYIPSGQRLYSLKPQDGSIRWSTYLGEDSYSSPIYSAGKIFIPAGNNLYCVDTTGSLLWTFPCSNNTSGRSAVVHNGIVYFHDGSSIEAINTLTGIRIWQRTILGISSGIIIKNNMLYCSGSNIYALNALTGNIIWQYNEYATITPFFYNNKIFVVTYTTNTLLVLDAVTGSLLLQKYDPSIFFQAASLNVVNDRIYCLQSARGIGVADINGNNLFTISQGDAGWQSNFMYAVVPMIIGNIAYLPTGNLYMYNIITKASLGIMTDIKCPTIVNNIIFYKGMTPGEGVYARDLETRQILWNSPMTGNFTFSAPCVVTKSGKIYRYGIVFDQ